MIIDNFKIDEFQLMAGAPIPLPGLDLKIHQPKLYEIALIGEEVFYSYLGFFLINKEFVINSVQDIEQRIELEYKTDYEIMKILMTNEKEVEIGMYTILKMLIKDAEIIKFNEMFLYIKTAEGQQYVINNESFLLIREVVSIMFNLKSVVKDKKKEFNPSGSLAEDIVEKLKKRKEMLEKAQQKQSSQGKKDQSMLADFVSILAVGLSLNIKDILNLTIYQIFNLMKRFGMYNQYQLQTQAMLQGAEDIELVDWFQKI